MTEKEFKDGFIVNFLASYTSSIYVECCMTGTHERLVDPPVEDAVFIANEIWEKHKDYLS